jgi:hypothetical protein
MITILNEKKGTNELFVLSDGTEKLADCEYSMHDAEIISANVYSVNDDSNLLYDSVVRAVLSRLDFAGQTKVISKNPDLCDILTKIGFRSGNDCLEIDTTEFFKSTNCNKSNLS